jgi:hypothetical protein
MPLTGRPRLTPEAFAARVDAYCARYGVTRTATGLPPFPTGQRESPQHRDWQSLYKMNDRLKKRADAPSTEACPVCLKDGTASHATCRALLKAAEALGPDALDRARRHLFP